MAAKVGGSFLDATVAARGRLEEGALMASASVSLKEAGGGGGAGRGAFRWKRVVLHRGREPSPGPRGATYRGHEQEFMQFRHHLWCC